MQMNHFKPYLLILLVLYSGNVRAEGVFGFPSLSPESEEAITPSATHDNLRWDSFSDYENDQLYGILGRSIGQLEVKYRRGTQELASVCTATLISPRLLITNKHCVYEEKYVTDQGMYTIASAKIYMNYHYPGRNSPEVDSYTVLTTPIESSDELDYAILQINGNSPAANYGFIPIKFGEPDLNSSLFMIHHSSAAPFRTKISNHKRITLRDCQVLNFETIGGKGIIMPNERDRRSAVRGRDVPHSCDSTGGSSGSLVFNTKGEIVGLHFSSYGNIINDQIIPENSRFNLFINIQAILASSSKLRELHSIVTDNQAVITTTNELLSHARQGGTLRLAATTFRLTEPLELSGDVSLIGQGYQQSKIISSAADAVIIYRGNGSFSAREIGFEHTGNQIANVVSIMNGNVNINNCRFTGGKYSANTSRRGSGLFIAGNTRGNVNNSLFEVNGLYGIEIDANASINLGNNVTRNNVYSGIRFRAFAAGMVNGNSSYSNGYHGISASDDSQPQLANNVTHGNGFSGIAFFHSTQGSVINNQSYDNGLYGIQLDNNARPEVGKNQLYGNQSGDFKNNR